MKVLLINGSPRRGGNTFLALSEIAAELGRNGLDTEVFWIGNKPVRGCASCGMCKRTSGACVFDDDICNTLSAKCAEASAIVVGSPVFYGQPNGALLALLQRAMYSSGNAFVGKPAACVAVCRRGGATAALQALEMPFQMMNMPLLGSQYWNIVYGLDQGQAAMDAEGMQTMRTLGRNMAWLLAHTDGQTAPGSGEPWTPTHFIR